MKITITGSLGNVSGPLTRELINKGHKVTVITSNPQKAKEIESLGAIAAVGKLDDVKFVLHAFTGADAVYCMIPPDFSRADQQEYYETLASVYAKAIAGTAVKRVVHLSSYGAHLPSGTGFVVGSYLSEQIFNKIPDITLTHMRPTYFYYNLLSFVGMIKSAAFIGTVYGDNDKVAMVHPHDIASAVAEELLREKATPIRYVSSDERTCNEIAKVLGKAIGIPDLKWRTLSGDQVLSVLLDRGIPENAAKNLIELGEALHDGRLLEDYEKHKPKFGKIRLEEYAIEFAKVFNNTSAAVPAH